MRIFKYFFFMFLLITVGCNQKKSQLTVDVYETSAKGNKLTAITEFSNNETASSLKIFPNQKFQTITGFGGSFTESSAYLLNKIGKENREKNYQGLFWGRRGELLLNKNSYEFL